jgi:hypothetical protein
MAGPDVKAGKREAQRALDGVHGVGGIGISWDQDGQQVLRIDIEPGVDKRTVEQRLAGLDVPYIIRTVSGLLRAM